MASEDGRRMEEAHISSSNGLYGSVVRDFSLSNGTIYIVSVYKSAFSFK
jgi:hypothetical protein